VKVPTPVLHRLAEKQLFDVQAIPSVHNFSFCGFGVRPGPADCDLTGVYDDLRVWEAEYKG
jgi:hypothetical protein